MSNNIAKYVALGVATAVGAGLVYLGVTMKRNMSTITIVIELEEQFEELYAKHGVEGREELIKQYDQQTRAYKGNRWRDTYRNVLMKHWEKFVAKQTQEEQEDVNPDE